MDEDEDETKMIINAIDNLKDTGDLGDSLDDLINDEQLPKSLIITNMNSDIFGDEELKEQIETLLSQFGKVKSLQYLKSFRRMRVNYETSPSASKARINLHQSQFAGTKINVYFVQPMTPFDSADQHLQPPAPTKQFLISPPSSPPIGWEPRPESEPLVNYDLLAAIARLTPGLAHELHAPSESQPGIVVHVCEDGVMVPGGKRIVQTACPQPQP
uniref:Protein sarah n=1 Tax=Cacopsylla melanoneura TaxID=428564 RepID=A0A8D9BNA5_9HEMI